MHLPGEALALLLPDRMETLRKAAQLFAGLPHQSLDLRAFGDVDVDCPRAHHSAFGADLGGRAQDRVDDLTATCDQASLSLRELPPERLPVVALIEHLTTGVLRVEVGQGPADDLFA